MVMSNTARWQPEAKESALCFGPCERMMLLTDIYV
jgi:hypothetical protein